MGNANAHVELQLIPAMFVDVTAPTPVPAKTTDKVGRKKFAEILVLARNVNVHVPVALPQFVVTLPVPLVQPLKIEALLGEGLIEIEVPTS